MAVQDAVGPDVDLMIDAHGHFSPGSAIAAAEALEPAACAWPSTCHRSGRDRCEKSRYGGAMRHLTGFRDIADDYDGFVIDLWGVLHDGVTPYPGAVACLEHLRAADMPVVLLSNVPRRNAPAKAAMRAMGIDDALYTDIVTSGEATWLALRDRSDPWFASFGQRIYHIGPEGDRSMIEGLDVSLVAKPQDADVVLNSGPENEHEQTDIAMFEDELRACRAAGLKMICANPDLEVISDGMRVLCAGALAERYEALGGDVRWIGKPDPDIYQLVFERLNLPKARILAVGDALRTDVAGATSAGIASCWVLGGIHGAELGGDPAKVETAAREAGLAPVAAVPAFVW